MCTNLMFTAQVRSAGQCLPVEVLSSPEAEDAARGEHWWNRSLINRVTRSVTQFVLNASVGDILHMDVMSEVRILCAFHSDNHTG